VIYAEKIEPNVMGGGAIKPTSADFMLHTQTERKGDLTLVGIFAFIKP
jgi:hypothetical protein